MTNVTPRSLIHHELIGLEVEIISSNDPTHKGVIGRILDETRNTLLIETRSRRGVRIPKDISTFLFKIPDGRKVLVEGHIIVGRSEDRLKMRERLW